MYYKLGSIQKAIEKLGYPKTRNMVYNWIEEYERTGTVSDKREGRTQNTIYTNEQIEKAVKFYHIYGKSYKKTFQKLGYPTPESLRRWVITTTHLSAEDCKSDADVLQYIGKEIIKATIEYCSGKTAISTAARKYHVSIKKIQEAAPILLGKEFGGTVNMKKKKDSDISSSEVESIQKLLAEMTTLKEERDKLLRDIHYLQMERDALEVAGKILKKAAGINLKTMRNREKAIAIDALRNKYRLKELLTIFAISKSSYCYQKNALKKYDKDSMYCDTIKKLFTDNHEEYGYRRIHATLKKIGIYISEKVVRRIMRNENLRVHRKKEPKFNSYQGEITPAVPNILQRDFYAEKPNEKWLTDITEFKIPAGKVYLSPILDCYDGMPVSWKIGISPNADLANKMLDAAAETLKSGEHPIVHSDRGSHYRWDGWIERMEKYGLTRSMSKKGCSPDNSACEGFFGLIKNAMFYGRDWANVTIPDFIEKLNNYLHWFREKRIKKGLGYKSPVQYRADMGYPFIP